MTKFNQDACEIEFISSMPKAGVHLQFSDNYGYTKSSVLIKHEDVKELINALNNYLEYGCLF